MKTLSPVRTAGRAMTTKFIFTSGKACHERRTAFWRQHLEPDAIHFKYLPAPFHFTWREESEVGEHLLP